MEKGCKNKIVSIFFKRDNKMLKHEKGEANNNYKHGYTKHPLYIKWAHIKQRCTNPNDKRYKDYGDRGIQMCDEWLQNPKSFIEWGINNGWKKNLTIERIDNNSDYCPQNCCFILLEEQSKNRRPVRHKTNNLPPGVTLDPRRKNPRYQSNINIGGKVKSLGTYDTIEQAHIAWCIADSIRKIPQQLQQ